MPICRLCNEKFPNRKKIDGEKRNLKNRKYCLKCSPFGKHNTKKLHEPLKRKGVLKGNLNTNEGVDCTCNNCGRKYKYSRNKGHTLSICNSCSVVKSRGNLKKKALEYKGGKCEICGYNKCITALDFHHTDPTEKDFTISTNTNKAWDKIKKELDKCVLVCSNCHREIHSKIYGA